VQQAVLTWAPCPAAAAPAQVPFAIVFTKSDMKKKGGPAASANIAAFKRELLKGWEAVPACFVTSSREGKGKTEVLQYLASLRGLQQQEEEQGAA
jgi:GTP-binding protein